MRTAQQTEEEINRLRAEVDLLRRSITSQPGAVQITQSIARLKDGVQYDGGIFVPLAAPLTSTSWDGDSHSTTAKTLIDLSAVFGAPAGIKAVLLRVSIRDSGSASGTAWLTVGPNNTAYSGISIEVSGVTNDVYRTSGITIPCDANGDIYYQCAATGSGTLDIILEIWGYWI